MNIIAALIIVAAYMIQPWMPYIFGYRDREHEAAKVICEESGGRRMAEYLNVSERISTLVLVTCKAVK